MRSKYILYNTVTSVVYVCLFFNQLFCYWSWSHSFVNCMFCNFEVGFDILFYLIFVFIYYLIVYSIHIEIQVLRLIVLSKRSGKLDLQL